MRKDLPKEINDALELLWEYADDASISRLTKEELDAEGYEIEGETAYYAQFALPEWRTRDE